MVKRLARLLLVGAVVLFSALGAENVVSDDSFACQITKNLELAEICTSSYCESVTRSSIGIIAEQDGENFDDLLVKTIKELTKEIEPENAANMYLDFLKNNANEIITTVEIESFVTSSSNKNDSEIQQALFDFSQNVLNAMATKNSSLEGAIYLSIFSDEVKKESTKVVLTAIQDHFIKISQFEHKNETNETEAVTVIIKKLFTDTIVSILNSIATVFENHGYVIDRQILGL